MRARKRAVALALLLAACGGAAPASPPTSPGPAAAKPASHDGSDGTICIVDGKRVSFSDLQGRLGELSVNPTPVSTATIEERDGSFGGTEEHYAAVEKRTGHAYDYTLVRTPTTHTHTIARASRPDSAPIAEAPRPEVVEHFSLDGQEVTKAAFEQALRGFDVDADPWVNAHVQDTAGHSGTSSSYEARDKKTRLPWTLEIMAVGGRASRTLSRGSHKSRAARP